MSQKCEISISDVCVERHNRREGGKKVDEKKRVPRILPGISMMMSSACVIYGEATQQNNLSKIKNNEARKGREDRDPQVETRNECKRSKKSLDEESGCPEFPPASVW